MKHGYLIYVLSMMALVASSIWNSAYAVTFTPPPNNSAPKGVGAGASRGMNSSTAASDSATLTAVLPESFYGTTLSERPTVMVYVPASHAEEAIFSIKDEAGNMHHQMTIPVAGKSGIIAVKLPNEAPALAVGENYQWFLALKVDRKLSPSIPYVSGWIQRIQKNTELATAMEQEDALKRAEALGKNGVWYDCVATLAQLRAVKPNNLILSKKWEQLLSSVSLRKIITAPLVTSAN
jgi:hypothetical protein